MSDMTVTIRTRMFEDMCDRIEELEAERDDYAFKLAEANNTYTEMHVAMSEANDKLARADAAIEFLNKTLRQYQSNEAFEEDLERAYEGEKQ